jgi:hypothetical protein
VNRLFAERAVDSAMHRLRMRPSPKLRSAVASMRLFALGTEDEYANMNYKELYRSWTDGHFYQLSHLDGKAFRRLHREDF